MCREGALKKIASSKSPRLLLRNKSFECADVKLGCPAPPYSSGGRKIAPKWRRSAAILQIDEAEVTVKVQIQTFNVSRCCVPKRVGPKDVGNADSI